MDDQNLIPSFQVDHNKLKVGVYTSRVDSFGTVKAMVTTYDVRMKKPNTTFISPASMHTIEHIGATVLRNHKEFGRNLIYWGPMGCFTGLYMIVKGKPDIKIAMQMVSYVCDCVLNWEGPIPGTNKVNCGNYKMHNLLEAKRDMDEFYSQDWHNVYPMVKRLQVKGVGAFHDS